MARDPYFSEALDPPDGSLDRGRWLVHIGLESTEAKAIEETVALVHPSEQLRVWGRAEDGEDITLALRVMAETAEEAKASAALIYRKARDRAGLPEAPARVVGYQSPWWTRSRLVSTLMDEAHELVRRRRFELAVIRMQTALEVLARETMRKLIINTRADANVKHLLPRSVTFADPKARELLYLLSGRRINNERWFDRYDQHLKRRNAIAHEGVEITHEDALDSIAAGLDFYAFMLAVRGVRDIEDIDDRDDVDDDMGGAE